MEELAFFTVKEFAEKLKVSEIQVRRWIDSGRIKGIRITDGHRSPWRIPYTELRRLHAEAYNEEYEEK